MRFDLVTLFPGLFTSFLRESLIGKALEKRAFEVGLIDVRAFTDDRHRTADDRPFGGGAGMVLKPEPIIRAVSSALSAVPEGNRSLVILLTPAGWPLNQAKVRELAGYDHLVLVCGRYEGVDQRVSQTLVDMELSVGDYILSGGEVPAMVLIEAVARLLPNVMGKAESAEEETFNHGLLEYPHYTRPRIFRNMAVPEVLLTGDHEAIRFWRLRESLKRTLQRRPDMLNKARLTNEERGILKALEMEMAAETAQNTIDDSMAEE